MNCRSVDDGLRRVISTVRSRCVKEICHPAACVRFCEGLCAMAIGAQKRGGFMACTLKRHS